MKVDICYMISHGFAARMLLQTNLIGRIAQQGLKVALVTPDENDVNLTAFKSEPNVVIVEWRSKSTFWDDNYLSKRMYYLENINQNVALKEKFWNGLFFSNSKHPWRRIRPLFYYSIFLLNKIFPFIRRNFLAKESKHLQSSEADSIIDDLNPRLVVSTYPVNIIEAKVLHAAKKRNIRTLLHLLSWDNITCKGRFPALPEKFIAWGDVMKEELQDHYQVDEEAISVCGVPHFDEHIRMKNSQYYVEILEKLGLDSQQPFLFFAMSSPRFAPREIEVVEWLSQRIEKDVFGKEMQLIIRPHPQNVQTHMARESWLKRLDKLRSDKVAIDYPGLVESKLRWSMKKEDMLHLAGLISGCSLCINSGSTVSIDSLLHDKPVILTSFDGEAQLPYWNSARRLVDYPHLKKFVSSGAATVVRSFAEMERVVRDYLKDPETVIARGRKAMLQYCYKDDGQATERVIQSLVQTLNSQQ